MSATSPRISVVVPTCNRSARMLRLLDALAQQEVDEPFEVIVVDDVSTDDTLEQLNQAAPHQPFEIKIQPSAKNTGPAGARNRGWKEARGEIIAFVDDDCVPDPGWLKALTSGLDGADISVGRTRPPNDQLHLIGPFSSYLDMDHNQTFSTCNIAYTKELLTKLDGFDEVSFAWPNGEDTDLGLRAVKAGFKDRFVADALMWHDVGPSDFRGHLRRVPRLEGLVTLVSIHPEARQIMNAGLFLRSVHKAVLIAWAAGLMLLLRPRSKFARGFAALAVLLYIRQFNRSHYASRSLEEWAKAVPLGFVADSWAVTVMLKSSAKYRTLLL
jgi:GT2 family glycosyltransferase